MNHAELVKSLVTILRNIGIDTYAAPERVIATKNLYDAIDAMQYALDDAVAKLAARDAEVERLRKDADRLKDFLVRQGLLEATFCTPDVNAEYGAWWLLWPVYTVNKTKAPLGYGNSKAEAIDAALSEEVKGGE